MLTVVDSIQYLQVSMSAILKKILIDIEYNVFVRDYFSFLIIHYIICTSYFQIYKSG